MHLCRGPRGGRLDGFSPQLCGSGCVCRPEFSIIYLKLDEFLFTLSSFDFMTLADSVRRLETQNVAFLCLFSSLERVEFLSESGSTPAEIVFTMRLKVRQKPEAKDDVTELCDCLSIFGLQSYSIEFGLQRQSAPNCRVGACDNPFLGL